MALAAADDTHLADAAGFAGFDRRAKAGAALNVVFFGGSLTWGAQATDPQTTSYRALVSRRLDERYPAARFRFWDAAIGGTGSQLGAFRLDRDVFGRNPDLVFLDFTINDNPYATPDAHRLASYEAIVRRLSLSGVPVVVVILPAKKDVEPNPPDRPLDPEHKEIANAYGVPIADAVALARRRVGEGKTTAGELWDMPPDETHPGDAGYALYADAAWEALQRAIASNAAPRVPAKMLHADTYMTVERRRLASLDALPPGWRRGKPHRNAIAFDFTCSRWLDDLAIAEATAGRTPSPLRLRVRGGDIFVFGESTPKSGRYAVRIDGGEPAVFSTKCAAGNMRHVEEIARGLDPETDHLIEIAPQLEPSEELRIESLCVAGAPATVRAE